MAEAIPLLHYSHWIKLQAYFSQIHTAHQTIANCPDWSTWKGSQDARVPAWCDLLPCTQQTNGRLAANREQKEAAANEDCLWEEEGGRGEDQKRGVGRARERKKHRINTRLKGRGDGRWSEGVTARDRDGDNKRKKWRRQKWRVGGEKERKTEEKGDKRGTAALWGREKIGRTEHWDIKALQSDKLW